MRNNKLAAVKSKVKGGFNPSGKQGVPSKQRGGENPLARIQVCRKRHQRKLLGSRVKKVSSRLEGPRVKRIGGSRRTLAGGIDVRRKREGVRRIRNLDKKEKRLGFWGGWPRGSRKMEPITVEEGSIRFGRLEQLTLLLLHGHHKQGGQAGSRRERTRH